MSERKFPTYPTKIKIAVDHGGRCAFCGPESPALYPNLKGEQLNGVRVGKFAHIHSESKNGTRYDPNLSEEELASRFNFLYVCGEHHNLIDDNKSEYTADYLKKIRGEYIQSINKKFEGNQKSLKCVIITLEDTFFGKINRSSIPETIGSNNIPAIDLNISLELPQQDSKINWVKTCNLIKKKWRNFQKDLLKINVETVVNLTPDEYHIYSITKIPIAIYFGALIQETNKSFLHQWRRRNNEQTWVWNKEENKKKNALSEISISPPNINNINYTEPIILKIEISSRINNNSIEQLGFPMNNLYSITVSNPNRHWLQTQKQLNLFCREYRNLFEQINNLDSNSEIHLFFAGPTPLAIFIGQIFIPRMDHPLIIYNWQRDKNNDYKYVRVFELGEVLFTT